MPRGLDDVEIAYDSALTHALEAIFAMRRFCGKDAIESLKCAVRSIERGQRLSAERQRREMARVPSPYVEPPPPPEPTDLW